MWIPPAHSPIAPGSVARALLAKHEDVVRFEGYLADRFQAANAVFTQSGTHALQLAIRAGLEGTDPSRRVVALPGYGCYDLVSAAKGAGARVAFYDVSPHDLGPEEGSLLAVAERAAVLVVANLFGFPLDWERIRRVAGDAGAIVIEDAAQGLGSEWGGRHGGSFGDLTVLSFGRGKGWTGGGGGALLLRRAGHPPLPPLDPSNSSRARLASATLLQHAFGRPSLYGIPARVPTLSLGETVYHPPTPPRAGHPFAAALAWESRTFAEEEGLRRRANAHALQRLLDERPGPVGRPLPPEGGTSGDLRLPLLPPEPIEPPDRLRRCGIYRAYPMSLPELPASAGLIEGEPLALPGARALAQRLLTIPTHSRAPLRAIERAVLELL